MGVSPMFFAVSECYHPDELIKPLKLLGHFKDADTPERTVCSYFSENPGIFHGTQGGRYFLDKSHQLEMKK